MAMRVCTTNGRACAGADFCVLVAVAFVAAVTLLSESSMELHETIAYPPDAVAAWARLA